LTIQSPASATITPLHITGRFTADNKIYDGSVSATVLTRSLVGAIGGDDVSLSGGSAKFRDQDVANGKIVRLVSATLDGADKANYVLDSVATTLANITPKALTMSGLSVPASKVYNENTIAVVSGTPALSEPEDIGSGTSSDGKPYTDDTVSITGTATGTYNTKDVLTATTVTFGGLSLTGAQAGDYTLTLQSPASATITPAPILITPNNGQSKVYGASDPAFTYTPSALPDVSITGALGRASGTDVGNYAFTLDTLSAGSNYSLTLAAGHTFAITPVAITITPDDGQSKVYGTADPVFTYTPSATPDVPFTGALGRDPGTDVGNYAFTLDTLSAGSNYSLTLAAGHTFAINPLAVNLTGSRPWDGTATASYLILSVANKVGVDDVTVASGSGTLASSNSGLQSITSFGSLALGGAAAGNYTLTGATGSVSIGTPPHILFLPLIFH